MYAGPEVFVNVTGSPSASVAVSAWSWAVPRGTIIAAGWVRSGARFACPPYAIPSTSVQSAPRRIELSPSCPGQFETNAVENAAPSDVLDARVSEGVAPAGLTMMDPSKYMPGSSAAALLVV